jgi:hypothetical protein
MKDDSLWVDDGVDDLADVGSAPRRGRKTAPTEATARHIGCPLWWFRAVHPVVRGKNELVVAMFLYRQSVIQKSRTITVANVCLMDEMGVGRFAKYRAIKNLEDAGLVTVRRRNKKAVEVTFCRRRQPPKPKARRTP